jgi:starch synthase
MYSMKYGTIPIVRRTGGLADTVIDFDQGENATGFVFSEYKSQALFDAIERARKAFADGERWADLVKQAMSQDFSWEKSAEAYESVYLATRDRRVVTAS